VDAPYARLEQLEPGIARVLAHNPSAFTYYGTQTYLIGEREVAVVDPGPDLPEHVDALEEAIGGRPVVAIMCTHTHRDHSPASRPLTQKTGAPIIGCAALALETVGPRADAAFDGDYAPDQVLGDGNIIEVDGKPVIAVATPGHTSNHLCFGYEGALLTGDHVMGWSTTVVVPPDGNMAEYMRSLDRLRQRGLRIPEDVAVTGFDDVYGELYQFHALTTVKQPFIEIGRKAVDVLIATMNGEIGAPRDEKIECALVIRQSA
jgi:glyoxylase-like metal-dependent hydrolase (beta-lactamase superfamily II)